MKAVLVLTVLSVGLGIAQSDLSVPRATSLPTIDGNLADWGNTPLITIDHTATTDHPNVTDDNDLSATVYVSFDDSNLYLAASVLDDVKVFERSGDTLYENDALEFWISNNQYAVALSGGSAVLHQFPFSGTQGDLAQTQVALEPTDTGYTLEVALPLSLAGEAVGKAIGSGATFSFAVGVDDTDTSGKTGNSARDGQIYYPSSWVWNKPDTFSTVILAE